MVARLGKEDSPKAPYNLKSCGMSSSGITSPALCLFQEIVRDPDGQWFEDNCSGSFLTGISFVSHRGKWETRISFHSNGNF